MKLPLLALAGVLLISLLSLADAGAQQQQQSVPPTPAPAIETPTEAPSINPTVSPAPRGRRARATPRPSPSPAASPSETPAPPQFTSLDGTWEIELQTRASTYYSHLTLRQSGSQGADVSGIWDQGGNPDKKLPLTGTFDGRLFKFTASFKASQYTFTGYVENYSDIVGMVSDGKNDLPFTAQHRKKEKFFNNITPGL
ncbi:MAG TPA: hypothetical protein VGG22_05555 [Candidatus Baltobacteraceae bacterium]|jgi:hypothetical protein